VRSGPFVSTGLRAVDIIGRKRDGAEVDADALRFLVDGYTQGTVSEGQMAAFLMAGVLRGFTDAEAVALTRIMVDSGEVLDLSGLAGPTIDKHSTGGVGDGTTLLVAPLLAAAGAQLVKLSGRGLGHTGGTLDKLESIPGFRVGLEPDELHRIVAEVGCAVAAQTAKLVPADKALYALRDVTGTVASTALIASSVMSKKIASGAQTIVLDVKVGDGAFMRSLPEARALAALCVRIGTEAGRRVAALVTDMDAPLGRGIGNALEVAEGVRLLQRAPAGRLAEVALALATTALALARGTSEDEVRPELVRLWSQQAALDRLRRMVAAQGGDPRVCDDPDAVLPSAPVQLPVPATRAGTLHALPARAVGELAALLGAGRARTQDDVDPAVGIELRVEVGDTVVAGEPLAVVHARTRQDAVTVAGRLTELADLRDEPLAAPTLVHDRLG
jgi:pyrimidine-nucleoside phosphorylase